MMIKAVNISVKFRLSADRVSGLKEYLVKLLKRKKTECKEFWAVKNISFELDKGETLGIIGHNGAGKSTLLKVIAGIMKPATGIAYVNGTIAPMLELGSGFDYELTGRENIMLNGAILGYSKSFLEEKSDEIIEFSELGHFIDEPIRNYSSGMVTRLAFSIATVVNPDILIVDEVLSVGDADFQEKSRRRMMELMGGGTTVLFVSHNIAQVREMCDKVLWLEHGEMMGFGETEEICRQYESYKKR